MKKNSNTSETRARLITERINLLRKERDFTREEFAKDLKKAGCPYYSQVVAILAQKNIITKGQHNRYNFTLDKPVYYGDIQCALDKVANINAAYQSKFNKKKVKLSGNSKAVVSTPEKTDSFTEEAIVYLKKLGFKIQRPIISYEEA